MKGASPIGHVDCILFAVEKECGKLIWSHKISEYDGVTGSISRVSPALHGDEITIGDILSANGPHSGANVIGLDRDRGALRWITQVDTHPAAIITGSPVIYKGVTFVGVASNEEALATNPHYPCCSFRGSVMALDAKDGRLLWKPIPCPISFLRQRRSDITLADAGWT
jgi:polyvinyl alcohol dehydrogenase (cytochrome)